MTIKLRGGHSTSDPRLDRIKHFDERSRSFSVADVLPSTRLRSRTWPCAVHLDQGPDGACTGFGWAHELAAQPVVVKNVTNDTGRRLYDLARKFDDWPGEDYEGSSVLGAAKGVQSLGFLGEYRWAFGIDDVLATLAHVGPVVLGTNWLTGMFDPDAGGLLDVSGAVAGGHCYLARGLRLSGMYIGRLDTKEPVVRIRNSWGPGWGVDGDAFIRASDLERLLKDQGEACVPIQRKGGTA
jgi:hypothetical protein